MSGRIPDRATAIRCLNQIPKLLAIYEPESPKLREDVTDSIELLTRPNDAKWISVEYYDEKNDCRHIDKVPFGNSPDDFLHINNSYNYVLIKPLPKQSSEETPEEMEKS